MHKIAIIKSREYIRSLGYDGECTEVVMQSISDWSEVTDEQFAILQQALPTLGCMMIERVEKEPEFIAKTVADYLKKAEELQARLAAEDKKRKEAITAREMKKKMKEVATEKELYEKLKQKFGE